MVDTYFTGAGFSPPDAARIAGFFKRRTLEKGNFFVQEGRVSLELGFVEKGQLQYYSLAANGEEKTTYIALTHSFVASLLSYLNEVPARENIRALSDTVLWVIEKSDVEHLKEKIQAFKGFYISLLEWQICCIDKGKFDLITLTAEQRYEKLVAEEPEILRAVPLQYIASMLGMTPRHLTRLRAKK
ncbi:Crp/Fnr family transcriptional regulator [Roseivirga sp. BDSF3-8]|uniref:Crp/Fnr family transcriptional regulator n=1 Tax=Roseivirga sp. BDSF3-8 TaxID=3241598 RepID=UPI003531CC71